MQNEKEKRQEEGLLDKDFKVLTIADLKIPDCCREGWASCPHAIGKKLRPVKRNVGL